MKNKKFIICGVSRAGKSIVAKRLQDKYDISWIVGDAIVTSMEDAFPDLGISHHGDLKKISRNLENYIKYLLWDYDYEGCGYVYDTTHLYPDNIMRIKEKIGSVPTIFLGYPNIDIEQKLEKIRQHDPVKNFWTAEQSDDVLRAHIQDQIKRSQELLASCKKHG